MREPDYKKLEILTWLIYIAIIVGCGLGALIMEALK